MKTPKKRPDVEPDAPVDELGDETGDASSPRPDANDVDEIGAEVGLEFADDEPLRPNDKIEERDRHRWELDPASDDEYEQRRQDEREPEA